jgi:LCP family protein required for cell wall assembly
VTIPRDTWIDIPGHGEGKINGAHAIGGNELTVKAVEQLSGLEIDNYIITDFDGFIPLIDFLGGVTVEVGEDLSDDFSGCYLSKGVHHLDGQQALALSRNRHRSGDGSTQPGAFAREKEAAKIIVALLEQKSTFERIVAMPLFINYLLNYTWTDLGFKDVIRLLPVMGKVRANDIEITGIPSWPQSFGKASAVAYDEEATAELFEEIKSQ